MKTRQFYLQFRDANAGINLNNVARATVSTPVITGPAIIKYVTIFTDGLSVGSGFDMGFVEKGMKESNVPIGQSRPYNSIIEYDSNAGVLTSAPDGAGLPPLGGYLDNGAQGEYHLRLGHYIPAPSFVFTFTWFDNSGAGFGNRVRVWVSVIEDLQTPIECVLAGLLG